MLEVISATPTSVPSGLTCSGTPTTNRSLPYTPRSEVPANCSDFSSSCITFPEIRLPVEGPWSPLSAR